MKANKLYKIKDLVSKGTFYIPTRVDNNSAVKVAEKSNNINKRLNVKVVRRTKINEKRILQI